MDPFSWAMLIMTALSTANSLTSGQDVKEESPTPATGGPDVSDKPNPIGGAPMLPGIAEILATIPDLSGPVMAAGQAAEQTQAATPEAVSVFNTPQQNAGVAANQGKTDAKPMAEEAAPTQDIGQILMAVPAALAATGDLLGINDTYQRTQRPAPAAGGQPGTPVGQFSRGIGQQPINIGQLLASLGM